MKHVPSRRRFIKVGAAAAVAFSVPIKSSAMGTPTRPIPNRGLPCGAPFHKPVNVPPVKYIREQVPSAKVPTVHGEYHEEPVPATCDVEESARLFLENYLTTITVPELYHEPFNQASTESKFDVIPFRLNLKWSYVCPLPKYREALPLLRLMTGSTKGLEIDKAWAEHLLKCIGPDGLSYVPIVGRPWDGVQTTDWIPKDAEFYAALPVGNGRLLGTLAIYYAMTGDEVWNKTAKGVVDRLNELAVWVGDMAFFPNFYPVPGQKISEEEIRQATATMWDVGYGDSDNRNFPLWQTWIITGLAQYYRVSGYEPARKLAYGLVRYMRQARYVEEWKSHFHCISLGIHAMMELALAAHDRQLAESARQAYEEAKSGRNMIAIPEIGFFVNAQGRAFMESCSIADMTALAVKLTQLGLGDSYWDDVDRYVRNCLTAIQRIHPGHASDVFRKLAERDEAKEAPMKYYELADRLAERMVGTFSNATFPNDYFAYNYFDSCCNGNCARALYYVWESILQQEKGELRVNLPLNRTSPWADVDSFIPYLGRVEIKIKKPSVAVRVRMNNWIEKAQVVCRVDEVDRSFSWDGNYLVLGQVKPKQVVRIEFPIRERTATLESFGHRYQATFKGNDVVELNPKGDFYPLFQRDYYRSDQPRYVMTKRFACENPIKH